MAEGQLQIAFIRRGFSKSGGAEAYLQRLAAGVRAAGHEVLLVTTAEWPESAWPFGEILRLTGDSPMKFADAVDRASLDQRCDVTMSLERVRHCDVYRAGDGVHRAWLERRARAGGLMEHVRIALNFKHQRVRRLEDALFAQGGAGRVIANSQMVREEIIRLCNYPAERIEVVYNGVPNEQFRFTEEERAESREQFEIAPNETALLFIGSGWERKGLAYVLRALEEIGDPALKLFVAGRGNARAFRSRCAKFLGEVDDLAALYRAGDLFLLPTIYDPFSNACLEALASGLPVITTKANGFSEIITEAVHGSIVEEGKVPALANAIRFWSNAARRQQARPAILELAAEFDISRNVARTLEILLQAASAESTSG